MNESEPPSERPRKERKQNADRRRRQILDATLRSIVRHGLARTTLATVAAEAGLSQGIAVFYFSSKAVLLTEALRQHYQTYHDAWSAALVRAGDDPRARLLALVEADFAPAICNADTLSIWFAFWGEQSFTPTYAAISASFDEDRARAVAAACAALFGPSRADEARDAAQWIDTLTDGYWQKIHLLPDSFDRERALAASRDFAERITASAPSPEGVGKAP